MVGFHIANADEYIIVTGFGIEDMLLRKKCFVWPFQRANRFSITPENYTLSLHAMTIEKLEFNLPAVFTIGPKDDIEALNRYSRLLATSNLGPSHLDALIKGIIEGETRVIAAGLTMEEIFKDRRLFKEEVIKHVQVELDFFGLWIYNSNVKQLNDTEGSEYFVYLRLKSQEGANNQAKVDVAEGNVGERRRLGQTRMENCAIEADTVISENKNKISILQAQAALQITQSDFNKNMEIANIESKQASAIREAQLQQQVEVKRAMVEEERRRGDTYAKAVIEAEKKIVAADAALYKAKKEADAALYMQGKVAEGIKAVYDARAEGIKDLYSAFGNDENATLRFLMLERGVYTTLAKINATAIQGLDPSITVWDTGDQTKDGANPTIKSVLQTLPPMLTTIKDQTGVSPPTWLANLQKSSTNLA